MRFHRPEYNALGHKFGGLRDRAFEGMASGALLVDHTTASADLARAGEGRPSAATCWLRRYRAGSTARKLNGDDSGRWRGRAVRPRQLRDADGQSITLMGPAGAGQLNKMANQICIANVVQGLAETLNFATRAGIDAKKTAEGMSGGAVGSWQMANRAATMTDGEFDFGFAVEWMRRDFGLCLAEAARFGAEVPSTTRSTIVLARSKRGAGGAGYVKPIDLLQRP